MFWIIFLTVNIIDDTLVHIGPFFVFFFSFTILCRTKLAQLAADRRAELVNYIVVLVPMAHLGMFEPKSDQSQWLGEWSRNMQIL